MSASRLMVCTSRLAVVLALLTSVAVVTGCSTTSKERLDAFNQSAGPMIAVRLATVAAVRGDPVRAQKVVNEVDSLLASIDAGQSVALDVLAPVLRTRIASAALKPAERAVLIELVSVASQIINTDSILPQDTSDRLRLVLTWVRSAALAQTLVVN